MFGGIRMVIGYTSGVFDLFHVGHVNILRNAKKMCDKLIVGVTTDDLVSYKGKQPVITYGDRAEVVRSCKYVDMVVPQETMDKSEAYFRYSFDVMFVGDDWYKTEKWKKIENELKSHSVRIIYIPYTKGTSSTLVNKVLLNLHDKFNN